MSLDLLAAVQQEAGIAEPSAPINGHVGEDNDAEFGEHMQVYDTMKSYLETIDRNTETVKDITKKLKTTANEATRKQIIAEKDEAISSTTQNGLRVKKMLDEIKKQNEQIITEQPEQRNTAKMDMRVNLFNTYLRRFSDTMAQSNAAIHAFKSVSDMIEKRQLKVVLPNLSDEQAERILESGKSVEVVQQALVSDNLQDTVRMIEERHDEIVKLERQVREIFELFNELATLVDLQQESLDVISVNVHTTVMKLEAAHEELKSAAVYQRRARNIKICCCLVLMCIIAVVVLIPTLLETLKDR
jgi:syntaxin 1B/2/3